MLDMRQAAEQVLFLAEKKKFKDVDIVVERNESLDWKFRMEKWKKLSSQPVLAWE